MATTMAAASACFWMNGACGTASPKTDQDRYGALWQQSTMRSAVAAGLGLNIFNRQADKLYMCNIAQMVNVLQSVLLTDGPEGKNCVRTTTYYAFMLFKPHRGKTAVPVRRRRPHGRLDGKPSADVRVYAPVPSPSPLPAAPPSWR